MVTAIYGHGGSYKFTYDWRREVREANAALEVFLERIVTERGAAPQIVAGATNTVGKCLVTVEPLPPSPLPSCLDMRGYI
jgi:hypothetical protein